MPLNMKRYKNSIFYLVMIGVFSGLMIWVVLLGKHLEKGRNIIIPASLLSHWAEFLNGISHNIQHPLALLLIQVICIIMVARLFGWFCTKIGQPAVVGEMIAGIVLGPSLLGNYFPEISAALFPPHALGNLQLLSQLGLILFMYLVGMELDLSVLKNKANEAIVISHASIILP